MFNKRETATLLAALSYLRANLDDAKEALADESGATGIKQPELLCEDEFDNLGEKVKAIASPKTAKAVDEINNMFFPEEWKHWEENGKPRRHIYHSLRLLNKLFNLGVE